MQNTFSQSGNDSKWFLTKIIFQNRYVALETPWRTPPLHGKCHLKFPFWFSAHLPYESTQALGIPYVTFQRVIHQILCDIVGVFYIVGFRYFAIQILWDSDIVGDLTCGFPLMLSPANAMKASSWLPLPTYLYNCAIGPDFSQILSVITQNWQTTSLLSVYVQRWRLANLDLAAILTKKIVTI